MDDIERGELCLDRQTINEAACLGYCPPAGVIVPRLLDYALQVEPFPYDPQKAKQLLAEAGYPHGFDAGDFVPIPPFYEVGEAVVNYLNAVGIRVTMRTMERAAFYTAWKEKKLRGLFMPGAGNSGNAATRAEAFISLPCTPARPWRIFGSRSPKETRPLWGSRIGSRAVPSPAGGGGLMLAPVHGEWNGTLHLVADASRSVCRSS